mgnify:CR=1 FL=1
MADDDKLSIYQELINRGAVPEQHKPVVDELIRRNVLRGRKGPSPEAVAEVDKLEKAGDRAGFTHGLKIVPIDLEAALGTVGQQRRRFGARHCPRRQLRPSTGISALSFLERHAGTILVFDLLSGLDDKLTRKQQRGTMPRRRRPLGLPSLVVACAPETNKPPFGGCVKFTSY